MVEIVEGDALHIYRTPVVIAHIVNNRARWGAGFAAALHARWSGPRADYLAHARRHQQRPRLLLGDIRIVPVATGVWVCSMFAQDGLRATTTPPGTDFIDYEALGTCLARLYRDRPDTLSVQMPKVGSGLAGGDWALIHTLIAQYHTLPTTIYTLPERHAS